MLSGIVALDMIRKQELYKIQNESAREAKGATKHFKMENLQVVQSQVAALTKTSHTLALFYEMANNITPSHLSDLVPETDCIT